MTVRSRRIDLVAGAALVAVLVGGFVINFGMASATDYPDLSAAEAARRVALSRTVLGLSSAVVAAGAVVLFMDRQRHAALAVVPLAVLPAAAVVTYAGPLDASTAWLVTYPLGVGAAAYATFAGRLLRIDPIAVLVLVAVEGGINFLYNGTWDADPLWHEKITHYEQIAAHGRLVVYLSSLVIAVGAMTLLAERKRGPAIAVIPLAVFPAALVATHAGGGSFAVLVTAPVAAGACIYAIFSQRRRHRRNPT